MSSFAILYVCTGNICRSPLAERLMRARLQVALGHRADAFSVTSAGTHGWEGARMDPHAEVELRRLAGDPTGFRARALANHHIEHANLVLTATRAHRGYVLSQAPEALRRTFTICEFAHLVDGSSAEASRARSLEQLVASAAARRGSVTIDDYDIGDPYGASPVVHRAVAEALAECVDRTAPALAAVRVSDAS